MPMEVLNLDAGLGTLIRGWGVLETQDCLDAIGGHLNRDEGELERFRYGIVDVLEVTETRVAASAIRELAHASKWAATLYPDAVVALVTSSAALFGLGRMWEMLVEGTWETRTFRARAEAESWIRARCAERFGLEAMAFEIDDDQLS